jgi:hypothetical protein
MEMEGKTLMAQTSEHPRLLAYVADLELEVDRLRKHRELVQQEVSTGLKQIQSQCTRAAAAEELPGALAEIFETTKRLAGVLRDLREPPGYHLPSGA